MKPRTIKPLPAMQQWYHDNVVVAAQFQRTPPRPAKAPKVYTPVSDDERAALAALQRVCFPVASPQKRFARGLANAKQLTDAQRDCLWRNVWRYRRQIADKRLVEIAKERMR